MLSDAEVTVYLIGDAELSFPDCVALWSEGEWDQLPVVAGETDGIGPRRKGIVIHPFDERALGPAGYTLTFGREYRLLSDIDHRVPLDEGDLLVLQPAQTALLLTKEFLCLSPEFSAVVFPRILLAHQGVCTGVQPLPPTWFGHLVVTLRNANNVDLKLEADKTGVCTCHFERLAVSAKGRLLPGSLSSLGRERLEIPSPVVREGTTPLPEKPDIAALADVARRHGYPWTLLHSLWVARDAQWTQDAARHAYPLAKAIAARWVAWTIGILAGIAGVVGVVGQFLNWW